MARNTPRSSITPELLLKAYSCGLFPMADSADDPEIFWVEPHLRGVIPLENFHLPRRLRRKIRQNPFEIRFNSAFSAVIDECAAPSKDRSSTWINGTIRELYISLHHMGHAHSVEAWEHDRLVGGLYGVSLGAAFFGESMFTRETDASKICLAHLVERLVRRNFRLLDTQFTTDHLKTFGAVDVPREEYDALLHEAMQSDHLPFDDREQA